ncbi:MAG: putative LmbE-like protein [Actinomycetia bacterium]|nr:putative LmbE-like protein [Actinomycetes bacterium]
MSVRIDLPVPARALAIGAHPDDIEFGCGATLAKWARAGCHVHLLVLTDGSKGSWNADEDLATLVATRGRELRDAAAALGASGVSSLDLIDGELTSDRDDQARVCLSIRETRPDVVLGHDPWKRYRLHPDHRHAGELTLDAIVAARDPHFFPEQPFAPHRPSHVLLFEADRVDHVERVDEEHVDAKIAALLCHRSQWRSTMGIDDRPEEQQATWERGERAVAAADGLRVGARYAEVFARLDDI